MDWGFVGALLTAVSLVGGGVGWFLAQRSARRQQAPRIVFSDLYLAGPDSPRGPAYGYAIGVKLTNVGGGPALHLHWGFMDPKGEWYAEMVHRAALVTGESTDDWAGIRGQDQGDDPPEAAARVYYERCVAFAECWDSRGDHYVFFPHGGGRASDPWNGPDALRGHLAQFPSRGESRRSRGIGR